MNINKIASELKKNNISDEAITIILFEIYSDGFSKGYQKKTLDITKLKKQKRFPIKD